MYINTNMANNSKRTMLEKFFFWKQKHFFSIIITNAESKKCNFAKDLF